MADADSDADADTDVEGATDAATDGTFTSLVDLDEPASVEFGAAGDRELRAGHYAYTGSAPGPGGFDQIDRRRRPIAPRRSRDSGRRGRTGPGRRG